MCACVCDARDFNISVLSIQMSLSTPHIQSTKLTVPGTDQIEKYRICINIRLMYMIADISNDVNWSTGLVSQPATRKN